MSESFDPFKEDWETFVTRMLNTPTDKEKSLKGIKLMDISSPHPKEMAEYLEKRQALAESLLFIATGYSWEDAEGVDDFHANYLADADDVLRQHPHLLGLTTREALGLWDDSEAEVIPPYIEQDAAYVQGFYEHLHRADIDEDTEAESFTDDEPEDEQLEVKPSLLPINTIIDDQEHGPFLKDGKDTWFELVNFRSGKLVFDEGPTEQDALMFARNEIVGIPADEFFKEFEILAAPLGWEPPGVTHHTLEYFNHETGKMERKTLSTEIPGRKGVGS